MADEATRTVRRWLQGVSQAASGSASPHLLQWTSYTLAASRYLGVPSARRVAKCVRQSHVIPSHFRCLLFSLLIATAVICVAGGCNQAANETTPADAHTTPVDAPAEHTAETNAENKPAVGTVARVTLDDVDREIDLNRRLHFCVFENGDSDYIYVGTKNGMWSRGQFDLTIDGEKVFTGNIYHLVYEGVIIRMGDVLSEQPQTNSGLHVTRVTGTFQ